MLVIKKLTTKGRCTEPDNLFMVPVVEMVVNSLLVRHRSHYFGLGGKGINIGPALFWSLTIHMTNSTGEVK